MFDGLFAPSHLILLAIIALVLFFGWKQLPDMSRSLGRSLRILKTEVKGMSADDDAREADRSASAEPRSIEAPAAQPAPRVAAPVATARPAARPAAAPHASARPSASPAPGRPRPTPRPSARPTAGSER